MAFRLASDFSICHRESCSRQLVVVSEIATLTPFVRSDFSGGHRKAHSQVIARTAVGSSWRSRPSNNRSLRDLPSANRGNLIQTGHLLNLIFGGGGQVATLDDIECTTAHIKGIVHPAGDGADNIHHVTGANGIEVVNVRGQELDMLRFQVHLFAHFERVMVSIVAKDILDYDAGKEVGLPGMDPVGPVGVSFVIIKQFTQRYGIWRLHEHRRRVALPAAG